MVRKLLLLFVTLSCVAAAGFQPEFISRFFGRPAKMDWKEVQRRCTPQTDNEPLLYSDDFKWYFTLPEMAAKYEEIYTSGKRLWRRAYFDPASGDFILPYDDIRGGNVVLSRRAILSIRRHIETALSKGYAQFIFFPDMGHSHFYISEQVWKEKYDHIPMSKQSLIYEGLLSDPNLKVLYHTAEQLKTLDDNKRPLNDQQIQWRYYTRNIVGDNEALGALEIHNAIPSGSWANTMGQYPGHFLWSAGFNISASQDGCFPFVVNGQTYYFDISLYDLQPKGMRKTFKENIWNHLDHGARSH